MPKVLIVEDDPKILRAVSIRLRSAGFEVAASQDATTAMTTAIQENPDLAILDISLPGMSGLEVMEAMNADPALQSIPVIALTAHAMPGDRERFLSRGFRDYLTKPITDESELLHAIAEALA